MQGNRPPTRTPRRDSREISSVFSLTREKTDHLRRSRPMMLSAYEFRQFAQNPPYERPRERRMRILYCAPNHAPAESLPRVNFGLLRTANTQADRKESSRAMREHV